MVNSQKLRGEIIAKGYTQEYIANQIGITPKTFTDRMKRGVFKSDEIEKIIEILQMDYGTAMSIFFSNSVTQYVTNEGAQA